jgi:hypothetical protein
MSKRLDNIFFGKSEHEYIMDNDQLIESSGGNDDYCFNIDAHEILAEYQVTEEFWKKHVKGIFVGCLKCKFYFTVIQSDEKNISIVLDSISLF